MYSIKSHYEKVIFLDKIFNKEITNHIKKFDFYLFKCEFKLNFNNLPPNVQTDFYHNTTTFNLRKYFLSWIEKYTERGQKFLAKVN